MEKYSIVITGPAKRDIRSSVAYITHVLKAPEAARNIKWAIDTAIKTLDEMPARVRLVQDERLEEEGIRGLTVKGYTIFFKIVEPSKRVIIVRVLGSKQDWQNIL